MSIATGVRGDFKMCVATEQLFIHSSDDARARKMMPVVERIARKLARRLPSQVDVDDLVGAGNLGLADAID